MKELVQEYKTLREDIKDKVKKADAIKNNLTEQFLASKKWLPWEKLKDYHEKDIYQITLVAQLEDTLRTIVEYRESYIGINPEGCLRQTTYNDGKLYIDEFGNGLSSKDNYWGTNHKMKQKFVGFYDIYTYGGIIEETSIEHLIQ